MDYILHRQPSGAQSTIGQVTMDGGEVKWWTCEDVIREPLSRPPDPTPPQLAAWVASWKVPAETCIPSGRYRLGITFSNRFQRETIQVFDVPGFSGIRIHPGNKPEDTEGCILPGMEHSKGLVFRSRDAVAAWEAEIRAAEQLGIAVWLDVRNPVESPA